MKLQNKKKKEAGNAIVQQVCVCGTKAGWKEGGMSRGGGLVGVNHSLK